MLPDEADESASLRVVTPGELFRALNEALGLSQRRFADQLGINHSHIGRLERDIGKPGGDLLARCERRFQLAPGYLSYCLENMPYELAMRPDSSQWFYWPEEFPQYAFLDGPETIERLEIHASIDEHGMCGPWQAHWATSFEGRPRKVMYLHLDGECDGLLFDSEVSCEIGVSGHGTQVDSSVDSSLGTYEAIGLERTAEPGESLHFTLTKTISSKARSVILSPGPGQLIKHCRMMLNLPREWEEVRSHLLVLQIDEMVGNRISADQKVPDLARAELECGVGGIGSSGDVVLEFEDVGHGRRVGFNWRIWP